MRTGHSDALGSGLARLRAHFVFGLRLGVSASGVGWELPLVWDYPAGVCPALRR
jgi:hypothetical protein